MGVIEKAILYTFEQEKKIHVEYDENSAGGQIIKLFTSKYPDHQSLDSNTKTKKLFGVFLNYISNKKWQYAKRSQQFCISQNPLLEDKEKQVLVNCYSLSQAFASILLYYNITGELVEYTHQCSLKLGEKHKNVVGPFLCFDAAARVRFKKNNDHFQFNKHCVLLVNDVYFDPTFMCYYYEKYAIFDRSSTGRIFHAAACNNVKQLNLLLDLNDFPIDSKGIIAQWTLLHWAAYCNNMEMIKLVLSKGGDPNIKDDVGCVPIKYAKDPKIINYLEMLTKKEFVPENSDSLSAVINSIEEKEFPSAKLPKLKQPDRLTPIVRLPLIRK